MNAVYKTFSVLAGLAMFAALLTGGALVLNEAWALYLGLGLSTRVVLLTVAAVVLIAAAMIASAIRRAVRAVERAPLVDRKYRAYVEMIGAYTARVYGPSDKRRDSRDAAWLEDVRLTASPEVLSQRLALDAALMDAEGDGQKAEEQLHKLIAAMRRDLSFRATSDWQLLSVPQSREETADDEHHAADEGLARPA